MEQSKRETETSARFPQAVRTGISFASEILNPFEALEVVVDEPQMLLAFLVVLTAIILNFGIIAGVWSALLEALCGGVPPQSLGLK